jgi:hypothetical protein
MPLVAQTYNSATMDPVRVDCSQSGDGILHVARDLHPIATMNQSIGTVARDVYSTELVTSITNSGTDNMIAVAWYRTRFSYIGIGTDTDVMRVEYRWTATGFDTGWITDHQLVAQVPGVATQSVRGDEEMVGWSTQGVLPGVTVNFHIRSIFAPLPGGANTSTSGGRVSKVTVIGFHQ